MSSPSAILLNHLHLIVFFDGDMSSPSLPWPVNLRLHSTGNATTTSSSALSHCQLSLPFLEPINLNCNSMQVRYIKGGLRSSDMPWACRWVFVHQRQSCLSFNAWESSKAWVASTKPRSHLDSKLEAPQRFSFLLKCRLRVLVSTSSYFFYPQCDIYFGPGCV